MRFAENNRISHRQLYRQMILALLAPFMLCVFGKGGMNGISAVATDTTCFGCACLRMERCWALVPWQGQLLRP